MKSFVGLLAISENDRVTGLSILVSIVLKTSKKVDHRLLPWLLSFQGNDIAFPQ